MKKITKRKNTTSGYYTKGGEFSLPNGIDYIGLFWKRGDLVFSGKGAKDKTTERIYPYAENPGVPNSMELNVELFNYEKLNSKIKGGRKQTTPAFIMPRPTQKDYEKTFFSRYFIKKDNTGEITEVNEDQFKKISKQYFYSGHELQWKLVGPLNDIIDFDGTIKAHGVFHTNQRTIIKSDKEFHGISNFIANLTQFANIQ